MVKMTDEYFLVRGNYETIAFHSQIYFDGKHELFIRLDDGIKKYGEFRLKQRMHGECEIIFSRMPYTFQVADEYEIWKKNEEHLDSVILSYFQMLKNKGVDFAFVDQETLKEEKTTLRGANAGEVIRLLYDQIAGYEHKVFYTGQIIDGQKTGFMHFFQHILWSGENYKLEVTDVLHAPPHNRPSKFAKALEIQAYQIQTNPNRVRIDARYLPFFENIVETELSQIEQLESPSKQEFSKAKKIKDGLKEIMQIDSVENWRPWDFFEGEGCKILKLVCAGKDNREIGDEVYKEPLSVANDISRMRKENSKLRPDNPDARIPNDHQRRKIKQLMKVVNSIK